jgi:hypothetical protein
MSDQKPNAPHSFCKFWSKAVWEGAKNSWAGFGKAIEIAGLFLGLGLLEVRHLHTANKDFDVANGEEFVNFWVAVSPSIVGFTWFLFHIFRQPYLIYKKQFEKHESKIKEKESKIQELSGDVQKFKEQTAPLLIEFEIAPHPNGLQTSCTIILKNPSQTQAIDGVELALVSIIPPLPHARGSEFSTDNIKLIAIDFTTFGMKDKKLTGSQAAHFPTFVVFETNPPTGTFFQFAGAIPTEDEYLWKSANHFSPEIGMKYIFTFHGRARGLMQAEKQFKLVVFSSGCKPQITFEMI